MIISADFLWIETLDISPTQTHDRETKLDIRIKKMVQIRAFQTPLKKKCVPTFGISRIALVPHLPRLQRP